MVSFVGVRGEGEPCIIAELYIIQYPISLKYFFDMHNLKTSPKPAFLRLFISVLLTMDQMARAVSFPFHRTWGGGVNEDGPYISSVDGGRVSECRSDKVDHFLQNC